MAVIKVSKKYKSLSYVNVAQAEVDSYKQHMIISSKEERDAHNAAIEAKKKAKHQQKLDKYRKSYGG